MIKFQFLAMLVLYLELNGLYMVPKLFMLSTLCESDLLFSQKNDLSCRIIHHICNES